MNASLPPKPKIDIQQYLQSQRRRTPNATPDTSPQKPAIFKDIATPPALPLRPRSVTTLRDAHSRTDLDVNDEVSKASLTPTKKPIPLPALVSKPQPEPRNYAPKPTHKSVPLQTHHADNRPPKQIPSNFLSNKTRKVLAANDRYVCISSNTKTLLYSWRSSSLVWSVKTIGVSAAFVKDTASLWLGTTMGRILVLSVSNGETTQILDRGHIKTVTFVSTTKNGIITLSSEDGKLNLWAPRNSGSPLRVTRIRGSVSGKMGLAATGGYTSDLLWLCSNKSVEAYNPAEQAIPILSTNLPGRGTNLGAVTSIAAFGDLAFLGQNDGFIAVFKQTQQLGVINGGIYTITALTAPSSIELWAGTRSGEILIFALQTTLSSDEKSIQLSASLVRQWKAHSSPITQITLAESKAAVLSIDRSGVVLAWNSTPSDIRSTSPSKQLGLDIGIISWNIGACPPESIDHNWIVTSESKMADILIVGLQEVVELENTSQHALNFVRPTDVELDKAHRKWQIYLEDLLVPNGFTHVITKSMVGIMTCLFVKREKASFMSNVKWDLVKTGMGGTYGNKGGIIVTFKMSNMSWCFANCHLAAGQSAFLQRNRDATQIMNSERLQTDVSFFFGDTNYRLSAAREQAEQLILARDWMKLHKHDQLLSQIQKIPSFCLSKFQEGPLLFAPTYKYDRGSNLYDTSDKKRVPSWCDRILFRGKNIIVKDYNSIMQATCSDHKPVFGYYSVPLLVR